MSDAQNKRAIKALYKEQEQTATGGIYQVVNTKTGRLWLQTAQDIRGAENRFRFAVSTNTALCPSMAEDWRAGGAKAFRFEVLETLEKKAAQSTGEFAEDLAFLFDIWDEKLPKENRY